MNVEEEARNAYVAPLEARPKLLILLISILFSIWPPGRLMRIGCGAGPNGQHCTLGPEGRGDLEASRSVAPR